METEEIVGAVEAHKGVLPPVWISFSCVDETKVANNDVFEDCLRVVTASPAISGRGINCTSPYLCTTLVEKIRAAGEGEILCYPNSGETYQFWQQKWTEEDEYRKSQQFPFEELALQWRQAGATVIGGCCRAAKSQKNLN
jgi:homocysteine S-methyltransferase